MSHFDFHNYYSWQPNPTTSAAAVADAGAPFLNVWSTTMPTPYQQAVTTSQQQQLFTTTSVPSTLPPPPATLIIPDSNYNGNNSSATQQRDEGDDDDMLPPSASPLLKGRDPQILLLDDDEQQQQGRRYLSDYYPEGEHPTSSRYAVVLSPQRNSCCLTATGSTILAGQRRLQESPYAFCRPLSAPLLLEHEPNRGYGDVEALPSRYPLLLTAGPSVRPPPHPLPSPLLRSLSSSEPRVIELPDDYISDQEDDAEGGSAENAREFSAAQRAAAHQQKKNNCEGSISSRSSRKRLRCWDGERRTAEHDGSTVGHSAFEPPTKSSRFEQHVWTPDEQKHHEAAKLWEVHLAHQHAVPRATAAPAICTYLGQEEDLGNQQFNVSPSTSCSRRASTLPSPQQERKKRPRADDEPSADVDPSM